MKYLTRLFLLALLGMAIMAACKKDDEPGPQPEPIRDSQLTSFNWSLDSIGTIGGSAGVITQQDFDSTGLLAGSALVFSFKDDFKVSGYYTGIQGGGTYSLDKGNVILIDNFRRIDESNVQSEWFNIAASSINDAERYSIIGNKLSIFFDENTMQMHFTKL